MPQQIDIKAGILTGSDVAADSRGDRFHKFLALSFEGVFAWLNFTWSSARQPTTQLRGVVLLQRLQDSGGSDRGCGLR